MEFLTGLFILLLIGVFFSLLMINPIGQLILFGATVYGAYSCVAANLGEYDESERKTSLLPSIAAAIIAIICATVFFVNATCVDCRCDGFYAGIGKGESEVNQTGISIDAENSNSVCGHPGTAAACRQYYECKRNNPLGHPWVFLPLLVSILSFSVAISFFPKKKYNKVALIPINNLPLEPSSENVREASAKGEFGLKQKNGGACFEFSVPDGEVNVGLSCFDCKGGIYEHYDDEEDKGYDTTILNVDPGIQGYGEEVATAEENVNYTGKIKGVIFTTWIWPDKFPVDVCYWSFYVSIGKGLYETEAGFHRTITLYFSPTNDSDHRTVITYDIEKMRGENRTSNGIVFIGYIKRDGEKFTFFATKDLYIDHDLTELYANSGLDDHLPSLLKIAIGRDPLHIIEV